MRSYGGVVNAFSRVRKSWHNVYTQVVETPPPPENPGEAWDSGTAGSGRRYGTENKENEGLGLVIAT